MLHASEIWDSIVNFLPKKKWVSLAEIYNTVEAHCTLDGEDFLPQSPRSSLPKWERNVRNVLQRKKANNIDWDKAAHYRLN